MPKDKWIIVQPQFDTGVQQRDNTWTVVPETTQHIQTPDERNKEISGYKPYVDPTNTKFNRIMQQTWNGAKVPFQMFGADPDLIKDNPKVGIPQALTSAITAELPLGEIYQGAKQGVKAVGKALGTESGVLSNAYKYNPWAFKTDAEAGYRMIGGKEGYIDALKSGEIRPMNLSMNAKANNHDVAFFNKGEPLNKKRMGELGYMGYEGPYMAEMKHGNWKGFGDMPGMYQTSEDLSKHIWQNERLGHIKTNDIRLKLYKEHWLKGYKEVPKEINANIQLPGQHFGDDFNYVNPRLGNSMGTNQDVLNVQHENAYGYKTPMFNELDPHGADFIKGIYNKKTSGSTDDIRTTKLWNDMYRENNIMTKGEENLTSNAARKQVNVPKTDKIPRAKYELNPDGSLKNVGKLRESQLLEPVNGLDFRDYVMNTKNRFGGRLKNTQWTII